MKNRCFRAENIRSSCPTWKCFPDEYSAKEHARTEMSHTHCAQARKTRMQCGMKGSETEKRQRSILRTAAAQQPQHTPHMADYAVVQTFPAHVVGWQNCSAFWGSQRIPKFASRYAAPKHTSSVTGTVGTPQMAEQRIESNISGIGQRRSSSANVGVVCDLCTVRLTIRIPHLLPRNRLRLTRSDWSHWTTAEGRPSSMVATSI